MEITSKDKVKTSDSVECPIGYRHVANIFKEFEAVKHSISERAINGLLEFYEVSTHSECHNCYNIEEMFAVLEKVAMTAVFKGNFFYDKASGVTFKADWLPLWRKNNLS